MNNDPSFRHRNRFTFQVIACAMIVLPTIGLFQSAAKGLSGLTTALIGVVAAGMGLAIWFN